MSSTESNKKRKAAQGMVMGMLLGILLGTILGQMWWMAVAAGAAFDAVAG